MHSTIVAPLRQLAAIPAKVSTEIASVLTCYLQVGDDNKHTFIWSVNLIGLDVGDVSILQRIRYIVNCIANAKTPAQMQDITCTDAKSYREFRNKMKTK